MTDTNLHNVEQARLRATIEMLKKQRDQALNDVVTMAGEAAAARSEIGALRSRLAAMQAEQRAAAREPQPANDVAH